MKERVPGMAKTEALRTRLEAEERRAGISETQSMIPLYIGLMNRHFIQEQRSIGRILRRDGRGNIRNAEENRITFKRHKTSMPSQEQAMSKDLELLVYFLPQQRCSIALLPIPCAEDSKTYNAGPIRIDEILSKLDEFLEQHSSQ